jgi:hypothetical protein
MNLSYTGCVIYPLKETCFSKQIPWALSQKEPQRIKAWFEQWSKGGAGPNYGVENPKEYVKKFNWVKGWINVYFFNKGLENLALVLLLSVLFVIIFYRNKKQIPKSLDNNLYKVLLVVLILFCEWFYKHPTLRYGGYCLLASLIFLPTSLFLSTSLVKKNTKKKFVTIIIVISLLIFNGRNLVRINNETKMYNYGSFPFFHVPEGDSELVNLGKNINIYIPKNIDACWATKTPCTGGVNDKIIVKKLMGFNVFKLSNEK